MAEYVTLTEFSRRLSVHLSTVKRAIAEGVVLPFDYVQGGGPYGGYKICWGTQYRNFMKYCSEARLTPRETWCKGQIDPEKSNPLESTAVKKRSVKFEKLIEDAENTDDEDLPTTISAPLIDENASNEKLMEHLGKNISSIEADRIRKIIRARNELLEYLQAEKELIQVKEFIPQFKEIAVILKRGLTSIPPRVCTQYAAMTDHFKIKKSLDKEIAQVLESFEAFLVKVANKQ